MDVIIEDKNFENILVRAAEREGKSLTKEWCESIKSIIVFDKGIKSLKGIENFSNLEILNAAYNLIEQIDLSKNRKLKEVELFGNDIVKLDLSNNKNLVKLNIDECDIIENVILPSRKIELIYNKSSNISVKIKQPSRAI